MGKNPIIFACGNAFASIFHLIFPLRGKFLPFFARDNTPSSHISKHLRILLSATLISEQICLKIPLFS